MRKVFKIFGVSVVALLYATAVFTENSAQIDASYFAFSQDQTSGYFTNPVTTLHSHTQVNLVYDLSYSQTVQVKDLTKRFVAVKMVFEHEENAEFTQYSIQNTYFPLKFSKPDIVYPFHDFL